MTESHVCALMINQYFLQVIISIKRWTKCKLIRKI